MSDSEELSPSYSWYPRDWRGSSRVRDMSWKERGFYRECLDWSWVMDGLPKDLDEIRRLCGASKGEFPKLWIAAKRMFDLTEDGRYRNARQEKERLKKEIFRRRAEDGGKAKAVKEAARKQIANPASVVIEAGLKQTVSSAKAVQPESGSSGLQSAESRVQKADSRERWPPPDRAPVIGRNPHLSHAACGPELQWCVPSQVHAKLAESLAPKHHGDRELAKHALQAWYPSVWATLPASFVIGEAFGFWQKRFDADHASPETPIRKALFTSTVADDVEAVRDILRKQGAL